MRRVLFLLGATLLLLTACNVRQAFFTYDFRLASSYRYDTEINHWNFGDLRGDNYDYLITTDRNIATASIYVQTQQGKVISQINIPVGRIQVLEVLVDPRDNSRWLFYSYNDQKRAYLQAAKYDWQIPLKREMKSFESFERMDALMNVPAYQWMGAFIPRLLQDIDGDGSLELVCTATDAYSANPRGVVAFDFDSGRIKWFFKTPCVFGTLLFEDFDGDGQGEFVLGSQSLKNTIVEHNGLDDQNAWIAVLSNRGELIWHEMLIRGYGEVTVNSADVDQDGISEIFALQTSRGSENIRNAITRFRFNGTRLISQSNISLPTTFEAWQYKSFLHRFDASTDYKILVNDKAKGLLFFDTELNEVPASSYMNVKTIWDIADINMDGEKEILVLNNDDQFVVLDKSFNPMAQYKNPFPDRKLLRAKLVQTGFEQPLQISIGCENSILFFSYYPIPLHSFIFRWINAYSVYLMLLFAVAVLALLVHNQRRKRLFHLAINNLDEGIIILSTKDKIAYANKMAVNLALEINPKTDVDSLRTSFPEIHSALVSLCKSQADIGDLELDLGGSGNLVKYSITLFKLHGLRKRYLVTMTAQNAATDNEKLQWADIARRLSHHVRRHITNVLLALDPLDAEKLPEYKEYLEIMKSEIDKIRVFTHAFQRFTEMRDYELKLQDLIPSIEHALGQIRIPAGINLIRSFGESSIHAYIEPIRFEEALINTINNATEAMPEGGNLHITIREFPSHSSPQGNLSVLVEIEDSGNGIPHKYMQDIWKPFFTTNQSGTGMGIPETKKIIDSMGGSIEIQSEEGVGTTVAIWLKGERDV